jgi:hypothetical protein
VNGDRAGGEFRRQRTACEISRVRDGRIVSCHSYYMAETGDSDDAVRQPARGEAARIAEEQAGRRRVATLVARDAPPPEMFETVIGEICRLVPADAGTLRRYENHDTLATVAFWSRSGEAYMPVGARHTIESGNLAQLSATAAARRESRRMRTGPARSVKWPGARTGGRPPGRR